MMMNKNDLNEPINTQEDSILFTNFAKYFFHNEFKLVNFT